MTRPVYPTPSRQRGASLVVVLILLLVMTLLGLAVLRTTLLDERMSANLYDRSLSFQSAETALRDAEAAVQAAELAGATIGFNCTGAGVTCPSIPANALTGTAGCSGGRNCWTNATTNIQTLASGAGAPAPGRTGARRCLRSYRHGRSADPGFPLHQFREGAGTGDHAPHAGGGAGHHQ